MRLREWLGRFATVISIDEPCQHPVEACRAERIDGVTSIRVRCVCGALADLPCGMLLAFCLREKLVSDIDPVQTGSLGSPFVSADDGRVPAKDRITLLHAEHATAR